MGSTAPTGAVVRVDIDPVEAHGNLPASVALVADAAAALDALLAVLAPRLDADNPVWERLRASADREVAALGAPWATVAAALEDAIGPGDLLVADNAMVAYHGLLGLVRLRPSSRFLFPSGFGTLGYALPAAIGAKLARPDHRVVAVQGDGGTMFTLSELATAVELGIPLPIVVTLNGGYGEIRNQMRELGFPPLAVDLDAPDLPAVARALGGHGVALDAADELGAALDAAFDRPGPTLITVAEQAAAT